MIPITIETRARWEAYITTVSNLVAEYRTAIKELESVAGEIRDALMAFDMQSGSYNAAADAAAQLD